MNPAEAKIFGHLEFDRLIEESKRNLRNRTNENLHSDFADPFQRMLIAIQPDSYVQPHRHSNPAKAECFVVLRGCIGMLFFDQVGKVFRLVRLGPNEANQICDIPPNVYHSVVALEPNSIFLEAKAGPYTPISSDDTATWAPAYGDFRVREYLEKLISHFTED